MLAASGLANETFVSWEQPWLTHFLSEKWSCRCTTIDFKFSPVIRADGDDIPVFLRISS